MREKLLEIIAEQFNKEVDEIDENTSFVDDLNADSIDIVELIMSIEDEFDIEINDEDLKGLETIADVFNYLEDLE